MPAPLLHIVLWVDTMDSIADSTVGSEHLRSAVLYSSMHEVPHCVHSMDVRTVQYSTTLVAGHIHGMRFLNTVQ